MTGAIKHLLETGAPRVSDGPAGVPGLVAGVVMGAERDGRPVVSWAGGRGPRAAEVTWLGGAPDWAACCGARVVVGFLGGDQGRPIVLGLLDPPPTQGPAAAEPTEVLPPNPEPLKVMKIETEQELVLECGKARISLRADGRVMILGGYVLSKSTGVNKIRGGSVQIN